MVKDLESAGDIIYRNILPLVSKKRALGADFTEEGQEELINYHTKMCKQVGRLREAFEETNLDRAKRILEKEREYLTLDTTYRARHVQRLMGARKRTFKTHEIHMELMDYLKQINVYASNMAKTLMDITEETLPPDRS